MEEKSAMNWFGRGQTRTSLGVEAGLIALDGYTRTGTRCLWLEAFTGGGGADFSEQAGIGIPVHGCGILHRDLSIRSLGGSEWATIIGAALRC